MQGSSLQKFEFSFTCCLPNSLSVTNKVISFNTTEFHSELSLNDGSRGPPRCSSCRTPVSHVWSARKRTELIRYGPMAVHIWPATAGPKADATGAVSCPWQQQRHQHCCRALSGNDHEDHNEPGGFLLSPQQCRAWSALFDLSNDHENRYSWLHFFTPAQRPGASALRFSTGAVSPSRLLPIASATGRASQKGHPSALPRRGHLPLARAKVSAQPNSGFFRCFQGVRGGLQ